MAMATEKKNDWKTGFAFNSISGVVQFVLTAVLIFSCIPIFISRLGETSFGVFSTVAVIGNLTLFANLSLDSALVKFLAEQGKTRESDYDIAIALAIISSILVPISFIAYVFRDFILINILNIPSEYMPDATVLMACFLVSNALLLIGKILTSILDSRHKVYLNNFAMLIYNICYWGGLIVVICLGYGLSEIGMSILVASILWFILVVVLAFKEWGALDLTGLKSNFKRIVKKQVKYTSKIYTASLLGMLFEPLTKVLIANFAGGVVWVGYYEIGTKVRAQFTALFTKVIYPLYPIIAEMKDNRKIAALINKVTHSLCFLVLPVVVLVAFGAESFLQLWLGEGHVSEYTISSVIVLTNSSLLLSLLVLPIYYYIRAKNHAEKEIYIQGVNIIVNAVVILLLHQPLGFYSVLLSNALALFASLCLCLYYQKKYLDFNLFYSVKGVAKFIIYALSMVGVGLISYCFFSDGRIVYLAVLTVTVLATGVIVGYLLKILTKDNIELIRNLS